MKTKKVFIICRSALIAALYFVLSIAVPSISFGTIQFRISEALTLLTVIMPEAIVGLTIGCFFANMFFSPFGIIDMAIGTTVTLIAAILTYVLRKHIAVSAIPPVLLNALFVPLIWIIDGTDTLYYINMFSILISQAIIIYAIGLPLTIGLKKALPAIMAKAEKRKTEKNAKNRNADNALPLDESIKSDSDAAVLSEDVMQETNVTNGDFPLSETAITDEEKASEKDAPLSYDKNGRDVCKRDGKDEEETNG